LLDTTCIIVHDQLCLQMLRSAIKSHVESFPAGADGYGPLVEMLHELRLPRCQSHMADAQAGRAGPPQMTAAAAGQIAAKLMEGKLSQTAMKDAVTAVEMARRRKGESEGACWERQYWIIQFLPW
jgi:hypothetical protein